MKNIYFSTLLDYIKYINFIKKKLNIYLTCINSFVIMYKHVYANTQGVGGFLGIKNLLDHIIERRRK